MKVLLVGNDYYLSSYLKYLHLVNDNIEIYVVSTNGGSDTFPKRVEVIGNKNDLLHILKYVDIIYYFDDNTIPKGLQETIEMQINSQTRIKTIYLAKQEVAKKTVINTGDKPCVLILNDGFYNCCGEFEVQLIESFYRKNINVSCALSEEFKNIYAAFEEIIAPQYCDYLNTNIKSDLILVSIDTRQLFNSEDYKTFEFLKRISPDFVILCEEKVNFNKQHKLNVLQYKYGLVVDMVVCSEYISYKNEYGNRLNCRQIKLEDGDQTALPLGESVGQIAADMIVNKLYVPSEIKRLAH